MESDLLVLGLDLVSMGQERAELVLDQEALDQEALGQEALAQEALAQEALGQEALDQVGLVLALPVVVPMDQVVMGPAPVVLAQAQLARDQEDLAQEVLDRGALDQVELVLAGPVAVVMDQVAMDQEEQGPVLVFIFLGGKDWARINHPNQVRVIHET